MHKHAKEMAKIDSSTGRLCPRSTQSGSCLDRRSSVPIIPNKFQNLQNILTFLEEFDCLNRILQKMTQINVCSKMKFSDCGDICKFDVYLTDDRTGLNMK
jgi:hypothetical protein